MLHQTHWEPDLLNTLQDFGIGTCKPIQSGSTLGENFGSLKIGGDKLGAMGKLGDSLFSPNDTKIKIQANNKAITNPVFFIYYLIFLESFT